jgi:23S rRNA pseudouridine2457 synthase
MPMILLNKPYRVLSQFKDADNRPTLSSFVAESGVYAAGRLDFDSEGLMLLTDDGALQARISEPRNKLPKTYLVQVEGEPDSSRLEQLRAGIELKDGPSWVHPSVPEVMPNVWLPEVPLVVTASTCGPMPDWPLNSIVPSPQPLLPAVSPS